jgi:hypothetical protein
MASNRARVVVSPWGDGMTWHVAPQGSVGEVPATRRARRTKPSAVASAAALQWHAAAELVRTVDEALLAEIEDEADAEARRQIMLQQAGTAAERQRLEHIFTHDRAQASNALLRTACEHEAAVRSSFAELKVAAVDKLQALRSSSSRPTLVHKGGRRDLSATIVPVVCVCIYARARAHTPTHTHTHTHKSADTALIAAYRALITADNR